MKAMKTSVFSAMLLVSALVPAVVVGSETEHTRFNLFRAPGPVTVDGELSDWNLVGSLFICSDVEMFRDQFSSWQSAMFDDQNLYLLSRWNDTTPLNNPGVCGSDHGFAGDCLQLRLVVDSTGRAQQSATATEWTTHVDAWRGRDGRDMVGLVYGRGFDKGGVKNALTEGAKQAFKVLPDGKGYVQELSIPWRLLAPAGYVPKAGDEVLLTYEPNFGTDTKQRITTKDLFRPGVKPDRVFAFMASQTWAPVKLLAAPPAEPSPVRLADTRKFPVRLENGLPVVDWTGLVKTETREGFIKIPLDLQADGYVSLNIRNAEGEVVRHLLTAEFLAKGHHDILWDGLTTPNDDRVGEPVAAGDYTWEAIVRGPLDLRLVGWAHNAGKAPYDCPQGNWGGDQGPPSAVCTCGERVYLGWAGSEAGQALVCADLDGNVIWRQKRGGFGGASCIAADAANVYAYDRVQEGAIYRLDAATGLYRNFDGAESAVVVVGKDLRTLALVDGRLVLGFDDRVDELDAATGRKVSSRPPAPAPAARYGAGATCVAKDAKGFTYVGFGEPENVVKVFDAKGRLARTIGKPGGRALVGPWEADGMRFIHALAVDSRGKLWVAEHDEKPRRFSCWDAATGAFEKEFFGPTDYGATGGAISPADPLTMCGQNCEWRLDPRTGKATCLAVISRIRWFNARFGQSPDGRVFVVAGGGWSGCHPNEIFERLGPGRWIRRAKLSPVLRERAVKAVTVWSDRNGDGQEQPDEVKTHEIDLGGWIDGWYMPCNQALGFGGGAYYLPVTGWTACGAPEYDLAKAVKLPAAAVADGRNRGGMGAQHNIVSEDGRIVLYNGHYAAAHSDFTCYDIESGRRLFAYPNTYVGVHGGHSAPPAKLGLIRAAYDFVGTAKLPEPLGNIFVIGTDKGEWHLLNERGFYLGALFEGDPMKIKWPAAAVPGADLNRVPPGMGAEDFGGSMIRTVDGKIHLQAGKTAFINIRLDGLDTVRNLAAGRLAFAPADVARALSFQEKYAAAVNENKVFEGANREIKFTGNPHADFGSEGVQFGPDNARVRAWVARGADKLYLAWRVRDATPWVNGAKGFENMYAMGDTVDLQLGTTKGECRLSIGAVGGVAKATLYRRKSDEKHPRTFFSGVWRDGVKFDCVKEISVEVKLDVRSGEYVLEAAVSRRELGLDDAETVKGDFGATFGNEAGDDTVLRVHWSNKATGLVADEVAELVWNSALWGEIKFQ